MSNKGFEYSESPPPFVGGLLLNRAIAAAKQPRIAWPDCAASAAPEQSNPKRSRCGLKVPIKRCQR